MFLKTTNGVPTKFPYTVGQFRRDHKNISFPKDIPVEMLRSYGVYQVAPNPAPDVDSKTHKLEQDAKFFDGKWQQVWSVVPLPEDRASENVRGYRNGLLKDTDWMALTDVTMSDSVAEYRQALRDVTVQSGFPYEVVWPTKPE